MPMVNMPLGSTCIYLDYFQCFLWASSASEMQHLQSLTLLPPVSSLLFWVDWRQGISRYQPLSTKQCKELPNNHIRVTIISVNSAVVYHSQYYIHWRTSPLQPELAFHNQPLKCKTWIVLWLNVIYSMMDGIIPPDGMDAIFQLHCHCSISHKGLHQVQLVHRASLESAWVMKNKAQVTLKNQFIFDAMIPSLNKVNVVDAADQTFNTPPMNPVQSRGQPVNCYT